MAKFGQLTGSAFSTSNVNFDVSNLNYDDNGNILTLYQCGLKIPTSSDAIDKQGFHYIPGTNKLQYVVDAVDDPNSTHGDFKDAIATKTATTVDYTYDDNGNMDSDQNKKIIV